MMANQEASSYLTYIRSIGWRYQLVLAVLPVMIISLFIFMWWRAGSQPLTTPGNNPVSGILGAQDPTKAPLSAPVSTPLSSPVSP